MPFPKAPSQPLTGRQVNVINLADRLYYSQSFGNRATPAPGRTVIVSVEAAL
jgi:outer membrane receptor protein involved in Fe transport